MVCIFCIGYKVNWILILVLSCFLIVTSQPLLIVGEGSAEIKAAFSYDFINNSLRKYFDRSEGKATINLLINFSRPLHSTIEKVTGDYIVVPKFTARAKQEFNTSVEVSTPAFSGVGFFSIRENASLNVTGAVGNVNMDIDTTKGQNFGKVLLKGGINVLLMFSMNWRTLSFGYTYQAADFIRICSKYISIFLMLILQVIYKHP
jgi:hypothetical protein